MLRVTPTVWLLALGPLLVGGCGGDSKLGTFNVAPTVSITSPPDGSTFEEGTQVDFLGLTNDDQTPETELLLQWTSDKDGPLSDTTTADNAGNVAFSTASLSVGNHVIQLSATDAGGERSAYDVTVTINDVPDAPTISVVHPASGEHGTEGEDFRFVVQVADQQQAPPDLTLTFESDKDGVFCTPTADAGGLAECEVVLSGGDHALVFSVTDADQLTAESTVYFTVTPGDDVDDDHDGYTESQGDCNDGDGSVYPNATEYCNGRDDDCDGIEDDGSDCHDDDGDGQSENDGDCNDGYAGTFEGATEVCDGQDNDCDDTIDDNTTCYDDDGDGWTEVDGDCNDASGISYPRAAEVEDGLDNDCDGTVDEGTPAYDDDGDGYSENAGDCNDGNASVRPGGAESCDGLDNNCDTYVDEAGASGCRDYYYDGDRDGYGSSSGQCLCTATGYYDTVRADDCYDSNASANPAQTAWYTSPRGGDGSYDFNCDGAESHYYTANGGDCYWDVFECNSDAWGWEGGDPGCGGRGAYITSCRCDSEILGICVSCGNVTSTYTQACH